MPLSKCEVCNSKKLIFMIKQDTCGLLSNLGLKTPFCKTQVIFCFKSIKWMK